MAYGPSVNVHLLRKQLQQKSSIQVMNKQNLAQQLTSRFTTKPYIKPKGSR